MKLKRIKDILEINKICLDRRVALIYIIFFGGIASISMFIITQNLILSMSYFFVTLCLLIITYIDMRYWDLVYRQELKK